MEKTYHSLKDFELSYGKNAIERANDFQQYIEQLMISDVKAIG